MPLTPAIRQQISAGFDSFLKKPHTPRISILYQTKPSWPGAAKGHRLPQIAVIDSSFNPPHLAHLALASSPAILASPSPSNSSPDSVAQYDAHLLLLSSRNADKGMGRPGDANPKQRLEMMTVLARDLEDLLRARGAGEEQVNVAVGVCEEPLMKDKSSLVHEWLKTYKQERGRSNEEGAANAGASSSTSSAPLARLHWVVGWDTLIRFFALKYYPSPSAFDEACHRFFKEEGTTFVCARRGNPSKEELQEEKDFLESDLVTPWVERKGVAMFELPEEVRHVNSTDARAILTGKGEAEGQQAGEGVKEALVERDGLLSRRMADFVVEEGIYTRE